jgi:proline dehydrogenase
VLDEIIALAKQRDIIGLAKKGEEVLSELIAKVLPHIPPQIVGIVARRYIAGETQGEAIDVSGKLAKQDFATTMDILGEDTTTMDQAADAAAAYIKLIEGMAKADVERNISLKLTAFGLRIDEAQCFEEVKKVIEVAAEHDFFVRVDMEDSSVTDVTLDIYRRALKIWPKTGTVLQARLKRTAEDARQLAEAGANIRLCKGIYKEPADIAYTDDADICDAFMEAARYLLNDKAYVGLATHDLNLIDRLKEEIADKDADPAHFEFQALIGVPIRTALEELKQSGYKVRLYVPFGTEWYAYSVRRLEENPQMAMTIAMSLLNRDQIDIV